VALAGLDGEAEYFDALLLEIRARAAEIDGPLDTVYFGGGTPSYVDPARLCAVFSALRDAFGISNDAEITAEANPDDLTDGRLESLAALGVNRLSIGVQSLADDELPWLERRHDAAAGVSALRRASRVFPRVSADLMIGIPGQTKESLAASVNGVLDAGARHLSAYLLELDKAPKLVQLRKERPDLFPDDEEAADRWEDVDARASAAGLLRYEMSNWAVPGHESRHNLKYWRREPTLGFGVAAHSFDGRARRANTGSTSEYVRRALEGGSRCVSEDVLAPADAEKEGILLGLRLAEGVSESDYARAEGLLSPGDAARLADAEEAGLLERADGRIRLTRRGVLLSNEVLSLLV
jgi:oxygen-independent coproporphyrinogen-3 oxidase